MKHLDEILQLLASNYGNYLQNQENDYCTFRSFVKKELGKDWLKILKENTINNGNEHSIVREIQKVTWLFKYFHHSYHFHISNFLKIK